MKKKIKHLIFALLSIVQTMALACAFITTNGTAYNSEIAISGIAWNETTNWDTAKQKDLEILRNTTRRRINVEQQAATTGQIAVLSAFQLPASLQYIDDEAFAGTALVSVEIPENVEYIGERAFSDIPTLRNVNIPEKTTYIAGSAFAGSNRVTITGAPGSYARKYARENGIPFAPLTAMYANAGAGGGIILNQARTSDEVTDTEENDGSNDNEPAGRIAGEIKANITENGAAYHITGRAPPANA